MNARTRKLGARDGVGELAAIISTAAAGALSLGLAPLIVDILVAKVGLTASQAGICVSGEMAGSVAGAIAVLTIARRLPPRTICTTALGIIIVGNLLCYITDGWLAYAVARTGCGLGCGLTTIAYGMLANTRVPARNFAMCSVVAVVSVGACGVLANAIQDGGGPLALFAVISAAAVLALTATPCMTRTARGLPSAPVVHRRIGVTGALGVLMIILYFMPIGAFWAYVAEIARLRGQQPAMVHAAISAGFVAAGIGGGLIAAWLAPRGVLRAAVSVCSITCVLDMVRLRVDRFATIPLGFGGVSPCLVRWLSISDGRAGKARSRGTADHGRCVGANGGVRLGARACRAVDSR